MYKLEIHYVSNAILFIEQNIHKVQSSLTLGDETTEYTVADCYSI